MSRALITFGLLVYFSTLSGKAFAQSEPFFDFKSTLVESGRLVLVYELRAESPQNVLVMDINTGEFLSHEQGLEGDVGLGVEPSLRCRIVMPERSGITETGRFIPLLADECDFAPAPKMELVQGGSFLRGSQDDPWADEDEQPHRVAVADFYLGTTEVTQQEWACQFPNYPKDGCDNCPAYRITWHQAVEFCNRLSFRHHLEPCYVLSGGQWVWNRAANGYRLPTEAEWEYAAKGGNRAKGNYFPGGDHLDSLAWFRGNTDQNRPVATKAPNELGIYDMAGNVSEWCWDWYDEKQSSYAEGPTQGNTKVVKGGGWNSDDSECRPADRRNFPIDQFSEIGLRLARSASAPNE